MNTSPKEHLAPLTLALLDLLLILLGSVFVARARLRRLAKRERPPRGERCGLN